MFNNLEKNRKRGMKQLGPTFKDRLMNLEEYGMEWPGKPVRLYSWDRIAFLTLVVLDRTTYLVVDRRNESFTTKNSRRLDGARLSVNFASIHTSFMVLPPFIPILPTSY
jgi:hypothetical protein